MKRIIALLLALLLCFGAAMAEDMGARMRVVNCEEWISLRDAPSTQAERIDQIPLNETEVTVVDWNCGDFACVSYNGRCGYVLKRYLALEESYRGEAFPPSDTARYNINLFLSNFSEQYFAVREGNYDTFVSTDDMRVDFAINHVWFNKEDLLEWGEWDEYNVRLHADNIDEPIKKYLGTAPRDYNSRYFDLINDYYYWTETGGHVNDGFACLEQAEQLDPSRIGVSFLVCGAGMGWEEKTVCAYTPAQAQQNYWVSYLGHAVIYTGGDLNDRGNWFLERYTVRPV